MVSYKSFYPTKCVRLKDMAFAHLRIRDWIIKEILNDGHLLLELKEKGYTLEVMKEDLEGVEDSP